MDSGQRETTLACRVIVKKTPRRTSVWVKTGLAADQHPGEVLPARAMAVPEFYDIDAVWPAESLKRRRLMRANAQKAQLG